MRLALAALFGLIVIAAQAAEPLRVYAVNAPLADFARRLGGDAVTVVFPVPADRAPAFWRPPIPVIAEFQSADLILLNGAGFAAWTAKVSLPRSRLVDTSRGFADRYIETEGVTHSHGPEGEHSHDAVASFTWLDLELAAAQAGAVAEVLTRRAHAQAVAIAGRLEALRADLGALDAAARTLGQTAAGVRVTASHPRYQYFARAYGLDVASLDWEAGETPSEAQWEDFERLRAGARRVLMIWESEPTAEAAAALAQRGVVGAVFDPCSGADALGRGFIERMRVNLDTLAAALADI
jgi:zinc transport system substrate-binding protein